ncbi:MAG: VWA domain-containing protein [Acidobacteriota bacterium]|nr:VWA domain-containing protein [Acidobacteriota bacterium]
MKTKTILSSILLCLALAGSLGAQPAVPDPPPEAAPLEQTEASVVTPEPDAAPLASTTLGAGSPPPATLRIPVRLSAAGDVPPDLAEGDFALSIAGDSKPVEAVRVGAELEPWHIVLYLDSVMASDDELRRAGVALAEHADALTALGTVEVVRAAPEPRPVLPPTRDPAAVDAALSQIALGAGDGDALRSLRRRTFQRLTHLRQRRDLDPGGDDALAELIAQAVGEEVSLVQRQQDWMLSWLAGRSSGAAGRKLVILVSGGYDLEARQFYLQQLPEELRGSLAPAAPRLPLEGPTHEWVTGITALGWMALPLQLTASVNLDTDEAGRAYDRFQEASADSGAESSPAPRAWQTTSLRKIRRQLLGESDEVEPQGPLLLAPDRPLEELAAASGGLRIGDRQQLTATLDELGHSAVLTVPRDGAEGSLPLLVESRRTGLRVQGPLWTASEVPTAVSAARARLLLSGREGEGSLQLAASLAASPAGPARSAGEDDGGDAGNGAGRLAAQADLLPVAETRAAIAGDGVLERPVEVRWTIAQGTARGPASLSYETRRVENPTLPVALDLPVELVPGADRVAVVVEALDGSGWGGALAATLDADLASEDSGTAAPALEASELDALAEAAYLPRDKPIRLLPPSDEVLRGKVRFQTLVSNEQVASVDFYLDGERVERSRDAPFEARLRLGRLPRPHTVRVVAFDATGRELGQDTLSINDLGSGFRVRIVDPLPGRRTGPVDVQMDVNVPVDRRLDRLELSWNDRRVATLYGPPYRQRLVIPTDNPEGFIRAVATLDDGRTSEDVVFLNQRDFAERVQIRLVELYTVVTDRDGRPVQGLSADRFTVEEDGEVQELAGFNDAGDLPLTMGLTLDSSASMFVKLPIVQQAAGDFVRGFLSGRDRAFLVDFDTEPRMVREMTSDLYRVVDGIESLEADGDTHIWESIVYSLMELQGSSGKKALVVFSDGAEEEEALSFRTCQRFAQRLGIPIYLIVLHPGIARGDDLTASVKSFARKLERLAQETGGRAYFIPNTDKLEEIYRQIDTELRSQYLLTYYSEARTEGDEEWREVTVKVDGKGLEARTISGYFPSY